MSAYAAIQGSLVNMRNVGTHKSVALTIHVPEEAAQAIIEAFGWPTMTSPVSVAIARLDLNPLSASSNGKTSGSKPENAGSTPAAGANPEPEPVIGIYAKAHTERHWSDMTPAQQTGVIRNEPEFWAFCSAKNAEEARDYIRGFCCVNSCADIQPGTVSAAHWAQLQVAYGNFLRKRRKEI